VSALSNWVSSALSDSITFQRFSSSAPSTAIHQAGGSGTGSAATGVEQQEAWEVVSPKSGRSSTSAANEFTTRAEALLWASGLAR
jgi:hypothetical protein